MVDRSHANMKMLSETEALQVKAKEAIARTQNVLNETEEAGARTIEELRRHDEKLETVDKDLDNLNSKQAQTQRLQKSFDFYSLTFGSKTKISEEAALRERDEIRNTKEVYQMENFDPISQHWKKYHIVSCSNNSLVCDDYIHLYSGDATSGNWVVDFSSANIDIDGWTYAFDLASLVKNGTGEAKPKWNSYVRRRKWKFEDATSSVRTVFNGVVNRIEARKEQVASAANTVFTSAKEGVQTATDTLKGAGYVPRVKHANSIHATGLSSAGMIHHKEEDQVLDAASAVRLQSVEATDVEINEGIANLDKSLDRIANIAGVMNDEVKLQNEKINKIEQKMQKTGDTQALINAKLKYTINKN